jgi:hypothetical protein
MTEDCDFGRMYKELGQFTSSHAYTAKFAAERILTAAWKHELELWGDESRGAVIEEGLLTKTDIESIEREVFGAEE